MASEEAKTMSTALAMKHIPVTLQRIIDVGPGTGTFSDILKPLYPQAVFTGIEKWGPSVFHFALDSAYDKTIVADVAWVNWDCLRIKDPERTLVVFGNVLEKLIPKDALLAWNAARDNAKYLLMTLPIVKHAEEDAFGNPFERELTQWDHDTILETFPGVIDYEKGQITGAYIAVGETGDYA